MATAVLEMTKVNDPVVALEEQRTRLLAEVERIEQAMLILRGIPARDLSGPVRLAEYRNLRVWQAIREYLRKVPEHSASIDELVDALRKGECRMGMYPRRAVANACMHVSMHGTFDVQKLNGTKYIKLRPQSV